LILFKSASLSTRGAEDSIRFSARMSSSDKICLERDLAAVLAAPSAGCHDTAIRGR